MAPEPGRVVVDLVEGEPGDWSGRGSLGPARQQDRFAGARRPGHRGQRALRPEGDRPVEATSRNPAGRQGGKGRRGRPGPVSRDHGGSAPFCALNAPCVRFSASASPITRHATPVPECPRTLRTGLRAGVHLPGSTIPRLSPMDQRREADGPALGPGVGRGTHGKVIGLGGVAWASASRGRVPSGSGWWQGEPDPPDGVKPSGRLSSYGRGTNRTRPPARPRPPSQNDKTGEHDDAQRQGRHRHRRQLRDREGHRPGLGGRRSQRGDRLRGRRGRHRGPREAGRRVGRPRRSG